MLQTNFSGKTTVKCHVPEAMPPWTDTAHWVLRSSEQGQHSERVSPLLLPTSQLQLS